MPIHIKELVIKAMVGESDRSRSGRRNHVDTADTKEVKEAQSTVNQVMEILKHKNER